MEDILENLGMPQLSVHGAYQVLTRRKPIEDSSESKLAKVLSAFDLTALGIGSTLGVGVYVLAGAESRNDAGPAVILSFLIAAIASMMAGLCYAEFGARVPKAGSAYVYSYVTIGEFIAFVIGWILILEYAIGSASVVKALSNYLDSQFHYPMRNYLIEVVPMNVTGMASYPDPFAFTVTMLYSACIAIGAKESARISNIITMLNLCVVLFVIIAGLFKVSTKNWAIPKEEVREGCGEGGFAPYGITGVIKGAAACFYGFIGFDCIATAGEEAKNPKKSIPFAVITSLLVVFLAYFGISTVLTLMVPYYDQNTEAPLTHVFRHFGWEVAAYVVTVGAMFGLCTSLMGAMFPLPRIVFAMASDGLLFRFMGEISEKYRTPFKGTLITGFLTGLLAALFKLDQLIHMMSAGTLLAYSMVAGCVLILRYELDERRDSRNVMGQGRTLMDDTEEPCALWRLIFNTRGSLVATRQTSRIVTVAATLYGIMCFPCIQVLTKFEESFSKINALDYALLGVVAVPLVLLLYIIARQPLGGSQLSFRVPFVPWLPGLSIWMNIYLMCKLDAITWLRFFVWLGIGLLIYFSYGIRNSRLRQQGARGLNPLRTDYSDTSSNGGAPNAAAVPLMLMQTTTGANGTAGTITC